MDRRFEKTRKTDSEDGDEVTVMKNMAIVLASVCLLVMANVQAEDRVDLEGTTITGNRELPKVLYIVPWKKPDLDDLLERPVASLVDDILGPVDRDVFRRQVEYYEFVENPAMEQK